MESKPIDPNDTEALQRQIAELQAKLAVAQQANVSGSGAAAQGGGDALGEPSVSPPASLRGARNPHVFPHTLRLLRAVRLAGGLARYDFFTSSEVKRLRKQYGQRRWRKLKGIARISLGSGRVRLAELHWYEAHGIGKKEIKRYLD